MTSSSGLPPDERGQALDVTRLPPWECCGRKGEHVFWCVNAPQNSAFEAQFRAIKRIANPKVCIHGGPFRFCTDMPVPRGN